ncbi:C-C motif chemokine 22 [Ornithorhynchus anatinus]|uniref:C-C motif chemokine 22 n=1 Tax=Ornithorhynchus anatinus TaxID=9258 RepID=UPI000155CFD1|nr:C-C motif chemokine 22 [Ornithorhynchus anatinus]
MKQLMVTFLVVLVLVASLPSGQAVPYATNLEDSICCTEFVKWPVRFRYLTEFYFTSLSCRRRGVVLKTVKNLEICADPQIPWVKKAIDLLKLKKK